MTPAHYGKSALTSCCRNFICSSTLLLLFGFSFPTVLTSTFTLQPRTINNFVVNSHAINYYAINYYITNIALPFRNHDVNPEQQLTKGRTGQALSSTFLSSPAGHGLYRLSSLSRRLAMKTNNNLLYRYYSMRWK